MMQAIIHSYLEDLFKQVLNPSLIQVQKIRPEFEGDITLVVFPLLKVSGKSPEKTAEEIGNYLIQKKSYFTQFQVVKGFLNLHLSDDFFKQEWHKMQDPLWLKVSPKNETVVVEYASPNTNKPLHLGHVRNILLGNSVARILQVVGYDVVKAQIINDRGIHICKSMLAWQKWARGETPTSSGMKGDTLVGKYYVLFGTKNKEQAKELIAQGVKEEDAENKTSLMQEAREMLQKWEAGDEQVMQLWKTMNAWVYEGFDKTYQALRVDFDKLYYESNTYLFGKEKVEDGLKKGLFFQKEDGSIWVDLTADGLDQKLVLRADGTSVYITQDIGTAILRFQDYPNTVKQIYTVGNEQDYHFKVLFLILQKLGYAWAKNNYHLSYGMMELPSGKMKTREGTVVDADDLMQEMYQTAKSTSEELGKVGDLPEAEKEKLYWNIGLSALKYFILKVDPKKKMLFDPKESIDFNGHTGPFIQYTHARIQAIARKASEAFLSADTNADDRSPLLEAEKTLIQSLMEYPQKLQEAADKYDPSTLANYLYELARNYNHLYQSLPILREENTALRQNRIEYSLKTGQVLRHGLDLLGIQAPEKM